MLFPWQRAPVPGSCFQETLPGHDPSLYVTCICYLALPKHTTSVLATDLKSSCEVQKHTAATASRWCWCLPSAGPTRCHTNGTQMLASSVLGPCPRSCFLSPWSTSRDVLVFQLHSCKQRRSTRLALRLVCPVPGTLLPHGQGRTAGPPGWRCTWPRGGPDCTQGLQVQMSPMTLGGSHACVEDGGRVMAARLGTSVSGS